jgi:hypothetical protein
MNIWTLKSQVYHAYLEKTDTATLSVFQFAPEGSIPSNKNAKVATERTVTDIVNHDLNY